MSRLNGRLDKVEAVLIPPTGPARCRSCGLRHVRPLTIAIIRGALRIVGGSDVAHGPPTPPLCLCAPCCGESGDRWLARLSHSLPADESAA
jgi:hypothetical protein